MIPSGWRRVAPWVVSAAALGYVLGFATDWQEIRAAADRANVPLFLFYATLDKLIFFLWWGVLQAKVLRRFVSHVSTGEVVAVRGGAELLRTVNNPVADAGFIYGMVQLTRGDVGAVVAAFGVPVACHFTVLLVQATLALAFLEGGPAGNGDVALAAAIGWTFVLGALLAGRFGGWERLLRSRLGPWLRYVSPRTVFPYLGWFALFAFFDVAIQGLASRAFGIEIGWWALAARIPILYFFMLLPSLGNFGTREIVWAFSFAEYGTRDELVAFALAMNGVFLVLHAVIGVIFLPRAVRLVLGMREARRSGEPVPEPLLHDAGDP